MKSITSNLPESLYDALEERIKTDGASHNHVITMALCSM